MTASSPPKTDYQSIAKEDSKEMEFPVTTSSEFRVFIDPDAYKKMKEHASITDDVELCGVLIGEVGRDAQGFFLKVVGSIEGEGANNYGAQVTFTHETWSHINAIKDSKYPDSKIVGWYHTHPGFGVFLSQMDSFIQDNYFNHPYQIAIVIETKDETEGCFCWVDGKSMPLRRYWVGEKEVKLTTGKAEAFEGGDSAPSKSSSSIFTSATMPPPPGEPSLMQLLLSGILFLAVGFLFGMKWGADAERYRFLDTEVLSLIEYAGQARVMDLDLSKIDDDLAAANAAIEKNNPQEAKRSLDEVAAFVDVVRKEKNRSRSIIRKDMQQLADLKHSISDKVNINARKNDEVAAYVADLYLLRLQEFVGRGKIIDPATLDMEARMSLKLFLDRAIMYFPENKQRIKAIYPRLIEYYYPQEIQKSAQDAQKSSMSVK